MIRFNLLLCVCAFLVSCGSPQPQQPSSNDGNATEASRSGGGQVEPTPKKEETSGATTACYNVPAGEKAVLKSQTFAIDFDPFKASCFVTLHDPEFTDPPLGAEIAIYKDGTKVNAFQADASRIVKPTDSVSSVELAATCWVEAVAFHDVNDDKRTDVILVGKCGTKSGRYPDNRVYLNNGKLLLTRDDANTAISEFATIKQIVAYANQNPRAFSLTVDAATSNSKP